MTRHLIILKVLLLTDYITAKNYILIKYFFDYHFLVVESVIHFYFNRDRSAKSDAEWKAQMSNESINCTLSIHLRSAWMKSIDVFEFRLCHKHRRWLIEIEIIVEWFDSLSEWIIVNILNEHCSWFSRNIVQVIIIFVVYSRLFEFFHFNIQSIEQKSYFVNITFWSSQCYVLIKQSNFFCLYQF